MITRDRPLTIIDRSKRIRHAITDAATAGRDWPLDRAGEPQLNEAISLLGYVLRSLEAR